MKTPVKEGDILSVEIISQGKQEKGGDGIAKVEGYTIFIKDTNVGDRLKIRVTRIMDRFGFAEKVSSTDQEDSESFGED